MFLHLRRLPVMPQGRLSWPGSRCRTWTDRTASVASWTSRRTRTVASSCAGTSSWTRSWETCCGTWTTPRWVRDWSGSKTSGPSWFHWAGSTRLVLLDCFYWAGSTGLVLLDCFYWTGSSGLVLLDWFDPHLTCFIFTFCSGT